MVLITESCHGTFKEDEILVDLKPVYARIRTRRRRETSPLESFRNLGGMGGEVTVNFKEKIFEVHFILN